MIAGKRQRHAGAEGIALDRGDDRLPPGEQQARHPVQPAEAVADVDQRRLRIEGLDVASGAEIAAGAGDHDGAGIAGHHVIEGFEQGLPHRQRERVAPLRLVQRDDGDLALAGEQDRLGHQEASESVRSA